jgi:ABC-type lipoprotein export system ATPase subunit
VQVTGTGLSHQFAGRLPLFHDLSFTLLPGHVYALTGPSGSGKSTLLSILAGWLEPTLGVVSREEVDTVAWVFQNPHGVPTRSVQDHVALPLLAKGMTHEVARAEARTRLAKVGLGPLSQVPFRELSGGEAQRLMLARGMASSPALLLVDEPTAQLDVHTADGVNAAIAGVADARTIVVVATHDPKTRDACTDVIDLAAAA